MNICTMGDEVVASERMSGRRRWSHRLGGNLQRAGGHLATPPAAAGRYVLVATLQGEVRLLEAASGRLARSFAVGAPVRSQPVVHDGWIYVGTENGRLQAINSGDRRVTGWAQWGKDAARTGTN